MFRTLITVGLLSLSPVAAWSQAAGEPAHAGWISVLPPLVAIGAALMLRTVLPALFLGVWLGAWLIAGFDLTGLAAGLLDSVGVYLLDALADPDHAAVVLFTVMIGGLIGIITGNGGTRGIVELIVRFIHSRRRGQLGSIFLGLALFIDDYANVMIVGNTMRPITDKLRISREKLALLVDSTAAPVTIVAAVSTWVGYQVGLIDDAIAATDGLDTSAYLLFLNSIAYSFYPWLTIFLLLVLAWTGRDFGPMLDAEKRAQSAAPPLDEPAAEARDGPPARAVNAIVPLVVFLAAVVAGLILTGEGDSLREIIGSADSFLALIWASVVGVLTALVMSLVQRLATLGELVEYWTDGAKAMIVPLMIVVLAWALAATTDELGTADFLVSVLSDALPVGIVPALVFVIAAATAFATGASWGTMAILTPLVVPLAWTLSQQAGVTEPYVLYSSVSAVLAGAVWGDHCSPISDTTILSSMASRCDHIEHVRTQLPYALVTALTALVVGVMPSGFGIPWWLSMLAGGAVLILLVNTIGRRA